jgi:DNA-binding transcriptional regulator YbjK
LDALFDPQDRFLTPRGVERRAALLNATFRIIVREGPGAVTLRSVVAEAAASHGSVKYYFGTIQNIIKEALKKVARQNIESLSITWASVGEKAEPNVLAAIIARHSTHEMIEDRKMGIIIYELHLAAARDPNLRPILQAWGRAYVRIVSETLASLGSSNPSADAAMLTNIINGMVISQLALPRRNFTETILRPAIERFLRSMR